MKYKTKLYLTFTGLVLVTSAIGAFWINHEAGRMLYRDLQADAETVAITGATFIDPSGLSAIQEKGDEKTAAFQETVKTLRSLRDVNRRKRVYILYAYILRVSPQNPKEMEVVVDATEDPALFAPPGTPYPEANQIGVLDHLDHLWSPEHLVQDRWGRYLTSYAPIYDESGKYVATLGVNITSDFVGKDLSHVRRIVFSITLVAIALGLIAAFFLSHFISRSLDRIVACVRELGKGNFEARVKIQSGDEFDHLADEIHNMARKLKEHERLKTNFIRYVSKHVMEKILSLEKVPPLEGEERKITVLFSDIRQFSRLAEKLPPEQVVRILNEYLDWMLDVIFANEGTLDKFIGDGLMMIFGAPLQDLEQERKAVKTAKEMQLTLKALNQKWKQEGKPMLDMGIGIHTGAAIVGNIGSDRRMEYTAIGDTVNLAFRIEQATKEFKVPILISEETAKKLSGIYTMRDFGTVKLHGRDALTHIFSVE